MNEVARNIKKCRLSQHMTQEDLAEKMFVTRQTISNWETGKSQPDLDSLKRLSVHFDVDITELIYGIKKEPFQRFQKKYIAAACISLAVVAAVIILELTVRPQLVNILTMYFRGSFELALFDCVIRPVGFLTFGIFVTSLFSFWVDTRLQKKIRVITLIIGIILLLLSFWISLMLIWVHFNPEIFSRLILFPTIYGSGYLRMIFTSVLPLLSGISLFLGINRSDPSPRRRWFKWVIIGVCVAAAVLFVVNIFIPAKEANPILMPAEIKKITIYKEGTAGTTFSYSDPEKIEQLTDYFTSLKLKATTRTPYGPDKFYGGEWQIRIVGDGICAMKIVADEFFQHPDGTWWLISKKQASEFEKLLKSMTPDELPQTLLFDEWK